MMLHILLTLLTLTMLLTPSVVSGVSASTTPQSYPVEPGQASLPISNNPDLIINKITFSPENPAIGNNITFTVIVENIGDGLAAPSKVDCYIDNDRVSSELINPVASGASLAVLITWKARAGDHIIRAMVDSEQSIPESNETNNELTLAFSVIAPNLIISKITWLPENPSVQDKVTFTVTIKNTGSNTVSNSHMDFYIDGLSRGYREVPRLDAGAAADLVFSWNAQAGAHEIKAVADVLNQAVESNEADNTQTVICSTLAPDFVIPKVTLSPAYPLSGDNVTFTVTINNAGKGKSYASHLAYYIDGSFLASDYVSPMDAGATTQKTFSWIAEPGSRAITVVADSRDENDESDETNNTKIVDLPEGPPDLIVQAIEWSPSNPFRGQEVTFTVTVKNQGHSATALSVLYFYIDSSRYSTLVDGIGTDNTTTKSFSWTAQEGSHTLKAIVDAENFIPEDNKSNNEKTATINPSPPVPSDLIVQSIVWLPEKPVVGDVVTFTATLSNRGSGQAERSSVAFYIDGLYIATSSVSSLNVGATTTAILLWEAQPGSHTIRAIADSNQVLIESNVNNNSCTAKVPVSASDLCISAISWEPANPSPGDFVTFTLHITNRGSYKARHSFMGYYISDSPLGNHYIEELESGETVTKTFTLVAPAGTYVFKAIADMNNEVSELDEKNNDKTITLPAPDLTIETVTWSPENPAAGDTATFSVTVNNKGGDTGRNFYLTIYLDGVQQNCSIVDDLKAGAMVTKSFTFTVPGGSHVIKTTVDEADSIIESDEGNNEKTVDVLVSAPPIIFSPSSQSPLPTAFSAQAAPGQETGVETGKSNITSPVLSPPATAGATSLTKPPPVLPAEEKTRFNWKLLSVTSGSIIIGVAVLLVLIKSKPRRGQKLAVSKVEH